MASVLPPGDVRPGARAPLAPGSLSSELAVCFGEGHGPVWWWHPQEHPWELCEVGPCVGHPPVAILGLTLLAAHNSRSQFFLLDEVS